MNKETIMEVFKTFKVKVEDIKETRGSTVTLYTVHPAIGTRISRIRNLKDELAVALGVPAVRIVAPMQDGSVGIEVPNEERQIVKAEDILNNEDYKTTDMKLPCAMGETIDGHLFMRDLADMPHLLIAGATGQGKSVCLNMLLMSMMNRRTPKEVQFVFIDPKQVELSIYEKLYGNFLAEHIATDMTEAAELLEQVVDLMEWRYDKLSEKGVRNIAEYNRNLSEGEERMKYCVVVVDEYADLIMTAGKAAELLICRIAQKARAVGIHMIIATQRPAATIVTGNIKANFPVRIAFRVASGVDSRVILDHTGAENLMGKGDMIYSDGVDDVRVQCGFGDTEYVKSFIDNASWLNQNPVKSALDYLPPKPPKKIIKVDATAEYLMAEYVKLGLKELNANDFRIFPFILMGWTAKKYFDQMVAVGCIAKPENDSWCCKAEVLVSYPWQVHDLCEIAREDGV